MEILIILVLVVVGWGIVVKRIVATHKTQRVTKECAEESIEKARAELKYLLNAHDRDGSKAVDRVVDNIVMGAVFMAGHLMQRSVCIGNQQEDKQ